MDIIYEVLPKDFSKEGIEKALSEKSNLSKKRKNFLKMLLKKINFDYNCAVRNDPDRQMSGCAGNIRISCGRPCPCMTWFSDCSGFLNNQWLLFLFKNGCYNKFL